jgi:hypothetical protein
MVKRSLWTCVHARVYQEARVAKPYIACDKGHALQGIQKAVSYTRAVRGDALEYKVCQQCPDFECAACYEPGCPGYPLPPEERGWLHLLPRPEIP